MKKLYIGAALSLVGMFGLPFVSSAATYHYVDITGTVRSLEATSASAALNIVSAMPNTLHTGVKLDQGLLEAGDEMGNYYLYQNTSGGTSIIRAATADGAYLLATDRAPSAILYLIDDNQ